MKTLPHISIDDLDRLRTARNTALAEKKETFFFGLPYNEEIEIYTPYAAYLIEYLEALKQLPIKKLNTNPDEEEI